ncbi:hypothetical protein COCCADRAFT_42186 [Bipolaris zeicola 26-R-13]|uniref:Uncharacterized protein n=1 Tax=Cochliobolus carbonum (strain 26-R-13) TaxID=930089 RepID=W6XVT5_COCC2|nr:uncharacterized protein COCCADRAFT_42186 [Bipolaris zeicola 26-R-13]EUC26894.1 hypothetical protein COCCADRAFT_42186 [Bipolaris zeicola 26-R-13]
MTAVLNSNPTHARTMVSLPARKQPVHRTATELNPSVHISLLAGAIAGGVEASATYPFEFAKTRAQLVVGGSKNPFAIVAQVARNDGFGAIYTGCSTLIIGTAFKASVRFLSFGSIRSRLTDERGILSPSRGLLAGMLVGVVESAVAVTPSERIKTVLIDAKSGNRRYRGGFHAAKSILMTQGLLGMYRGFASTTMKQSAAELSCRNNLSQNSVTTFTIGALAGTIKVYVTQPFDTIKTRVQSAQGAKISGAFRSILLETGIRGFWRGCTMRLGRLVFSGGIIFTVYEKVVNVCA